MNNVVGARINDILYKKMKEDGRQNTIIIREALTKYYFKDKKEKDVNRPDLAVNNKKNKDRYQIISNEIDEFLERLK